MYKKGDIVFVDFPFSSGTKLKTRPALIISGRKVNKTGDYIFVQITSNTSWADGLMLSINANDLRSGFLPKISVLRTHKIFTGNEQLIKLKMGSVTLEFRRKVNRQIQALIR